MMSADDTSRDALVERVANAYAAALLDPERPSIVQRIVDSVVMPLVEERDQLLASIAELAPSDELASADRTHRPNPPSIDRTVPLWTWEYGYRNPCRVVVVRDREALGLIQHSDDPWQVWRGGHLLLAKVAHAQAIAAAQRIAQHDAACPDPDYLDAADNIRGGSR